MYEVTIDNFEGPLDLLLHLIKESKMDIMNIEIEKITTQYMEFLDKIASSNIIDGVETYYSRFTNKQIEQLENYCKENNLLMSGGTDYHGEKHKDLELGTGFGNLVVNEEAIKEWI